MNTQKVRFWIIFGLAFVLTGSLLLAGCAPRARVGALQSESQSVEVGDAGSVRVEINQGAGDLKVAGGAEKLLEADFNYNVARLKPEVNYTNGTLVVRQPEVDSLPALTGIAGFRNEWDLILNDEVPMDLSVGMGGGTSDLQLAGLSLTGLDVSLGAGTSTVDLNGDWAHDLDVTIDSGAGNVTLQLPKDIGVRVKVGSGPHTVEAPGMTKDGDVYTNAAYEVSDVTLQVVMEAGIGQIKLEVAEASASEEEGKTSDYSAITGELAQQIQSIVDQTGITGLSVALVDDQKMVWSEGFGYADKENGVKATPETVYMIASISKIFTASAIMQLADQGKIDIDQPVQNYIPEFSINSRFPEAAPITPRTLMTHHSGMPTDWTNGMVAFGDDQEALTIREFQGLVQEIKQGYVTDPPNTAFSYSNIGYSLLGHAVEQVTGQEFSDYMNKAILGPMGMNSSSFTIKPGMKERLSKEYLKGEEQPVIWTRDIPAATLHTTVQDLSRYMMMVFGDGEVGGQRILRPESVAEMLRPQNSDVALDLGARWGLGWWLISPGIDYAGQTAWIQGGDGMWDSLMVTLPDHKLGVVLLSNSVEAGKNDFLIAATILEQALKVKAGIERPAAEPPAVVSLSADELHSYEGTYTTDLGWITIRSDGTDLYADAMGQSFKFLPQGDGRFSLEGVSPSDAQVTIKEVNGRTAMKLYGLAVGGLGYGERVEPVSIPEAWMDRVGSYEITNAKPGFFTFITDVQLKYENGFLMVSLNRADTGDQLAFPIGPVSDNEAVILGLGLRNHGETISVVEVNGEEQLFYSGYRMKKTERGAEPSAPGGAVYQDPQGRFTLPLIGDWAQVETDGSYAKFEVPGIDLNMSVLSVASDDLAAGQDAALDQAGIDRSALAKTSDTKLGDWNVAFYSKGGGQGVTPVCQVVDAVTYCLVFTGDEALTNNPPEHVLNTIQAFTIAGKETALPGTIEDFEAYVNSFVGDNPPGLSILITQGGNVLYSKGFGMADGPKGMQAEPDTVFMWGSMTKIVTGTAIMQLVDQGLVDLDAPVSDYLDYFPAEYGITVRQLLDHSDGLGELPEFLLAHLRLDGQPLPDYDQVAREYLKGLSKLQFEPGSTSAYANPGFVILGQIVAEVSGQPYIEYVQEHVLKPLGMANTDFTYSNQNMIAKAAAPAFPADDVEDVTSMVDQAGGPVAGADLVREVDDRFAWMNRFNVMAANGGLIGPATEAIRFAQMHLNGGELDGVRILSPESAALMQKMQLSTTGDPLGFGVAWRVFDDAEHPFVEHDGGGEGLWAKMRLYPAEGLAIVLMSNESDWDRDRMADAAANVVFTMMGQ